MLSMTLNDTLMILASLLLRYLDNKTADNVTALHSLEQLSSFRKLKDFNFWDYLFLAS